MNEHRIEFAIQTPDGIKTLTVAVRFDTGPDELAEVTRKFRRVLEETVEPTHAHLILHSRDFPAPREAP